MSNNLALDAGFTASLSSGGWAEGTNANTIQNANTVTFVLDARFYSKSATNNIAISYSGPTVYQAASGGVATVNGGFTGGVNGSTRLYLVCLDTSGAVSIVPGPIVDNTGKERLAKDTKADQEWKDKIDFYVKGVEGKVPAGK